MGLFIQEPEYDGEISGTFEMMESFDSVSGDFSETTTTNNNTSSLKKTKDGIILNPQPHDDPNDPLNWPLWKRDLALFVLGWHCFVGGGQTSMLAAGLSSMQHEFNMSASKVSYLVGGFMLSLAFGALIASPTAVLFGKRVIYILGITFFFAGALWGGFAKNFNSLMGARVLMGIGISPIESLPSSTIAEIYFAHERAYRIGIYTLLLLGGKNLVPTLSSFVFNNLDRHWLFWIVAIIAFIDLLLTILFVPETYWNRAPTPNKRSIKETKAARRALLRNRKRYIVPGTSSEEPQQIEAYPVDEKLIAEPVYEQAKVEKKPFIKELHFFSGRHTQDRWWMVFVRPFVLIAYPHVLFASLLYAFAVVWLIMISEVISDIFTKNPYGYSKLTVGLFYISPFIGGSLGSAVAGALSDILVRVCVKRNNGIYEPEFRLLMVPLAVTTSAIGLMGFGWSAQNHDSWIVPVILFAVLAFGSSLASTTSISFAVDSYKIYAGELLVTCNVFKNVIGFLFSLFNNSLDHKQGHKNAFVIYACIELFIGLFCIPLYIYGKRIRRWSDKKQFMSSFYVH